MSNFDDPNGPRSRNTCRCEQCGVEFIRVGGLRLLCAHCVDDNQKQELFDKLAPTRMKSKSGAKDLGGRVYIHYVPDQDKGENL